MKSVLILVISLFFAVNASADECKINLTENMTYQDMGAILSCLSNKIEVLEKEVMSLKRSMDTSSSPGSSLTLLDNKYLTVNKYKIYKDGNAVKLSFNIISKSQSDLCIAYLNNSAVIVDGSGKDFRSNTINGIVTKFDYGDKNRLHYTVLNTGVPTPVTVTFPADRFNSEGISFKVALVLLNDDKVIPYSVGKSGVVIE